jgi:hypothetical protein
MVAWTPPNRGGDVAWLIIHLIIQTIRQDPSGSVWIDDASDVSRPDPSGAHQSDVEHQTTDLAAGTPWPDEGLSQADRGIGAGPGRRVLMAPVSLLEHGHSQCNSPTTEAERGDWSSAAHPPVRPQPESDAGWSRQLTPDLVAR